MDTTPILAIPYPEPTDPITDYPAVAQDAAELIEAELLQGMTLLVDSVLAAPAASFDLLSIPQTYKHLRAIVQGRSSDAASSVGLFARVNNDTGANYAWELGRDLGATTTAGGVAGDTKIGLGDCLPAAAAPAGYPGIGIIDLVDYTEAIFHQAMFLTAYGARAAALTDHFANTGGAQWRNVAAVNRLTIYPSAGNWIIGSRISLYGIG